MAHSFIQQILLIPYSMTDMDIGPGEITEKKSFRQFFSLHSYILVKEKHN